MKVPLRKYNTSDVNMLTAGKVIIQSAFRRIITINITRPDMDANYFNTLDLRIDNAFTNILGLDPYKFLRLLTQEEGDKFNELLDLLITFHKQMIRGFRTEKGELKSIFTLLGFNEFWKNVSRLKNQNQMVELLRQFDKNMSLQLETQIYEHKIQPNIISTIRADIQPFIDVNIAQEAAKPVVHELTSSEVIEFNEIYNTIIDISVICWDIFKKDIILRNEFSFSKVVKSMGNYHPRKPKPETPQ